MSSGMFIQCYPKWLDARVTLMIAAFLNCISLLLLGPSKVFDFIEHPSLMCIGQIIQGWSTVNLIVLSLPEMIR